MSPLLAPGVITATRRPAPRWRRLAGRALRWAWRIVSTLCVLIVLIGLLATYGVLP